MRKRYKAFSLLLTLLLGVQIGLPSAAVFAAQESDVYFRDYNDGNISGWTPAKGTTTFSADQGAVKAVTTGVVIIADQDSPKVANAEYEVKLKFSQPATRFGLVYRFVDSNNYNVIQYDAGTWGWDAMKGGTESYGNITAPSFTFAADQQYTLKLRYEKDSVSLSIDGNNVLTTSLPSLSTSAGKIGLRSWFNNKTLWIDDVKVTPIVSTDPVPRPITITETLSSDTMKVEIDKEFPRVKQYTWLDSGAEMYGQLNGFNEIKINEKSYFVVASDFSKKAADATHGEIAAYTIQIPEIKVNLKVEMEVQDNILQFKVASIEENGTEKVKTIGFPNHDLVSVIGTQPTAQETAVRITGGWNIVQDEFNNIKTQVADVSGSRTYAFVNSDVLAASVITNVVNGYDKVRIKVGDDTALHTKKATISGGSWVYRGSAVLDPEPLPWAKVVLTPDANGDNVVDWQDGAIVYRQNTDAPTGSEMIRDNISYISMNIGSTTTSPFLRAFDNAKKISNLTDGFGQLILFKGYQAEGHDDSHPDYGGHIGIRQGGEKDFNYILSEGKKYNIRGGVHINATEYALDAFGTKMENMNQPLSKGWGWLDQTFYVNKTKDVESGELKRRLDMLKSDTGDNLSFVYVDVYDGADYNAKKLADYINGNGWMLGTEFAGPLFEQASWVHWGTDPGYPNQGDDSKVTRFLRNQSLDGFLTTPLLKGNKQVGVGYWQNSAPFYSYQSTSAAFFNHNLPTKYMQHFPIIKMTDNRIDFAEKVVVERKQDGKIHLSKDGREIAIMTDSSNISDSTVFIPWSPETEDKIYHWNPAGGQTTWSLPESWSNVTTAQLYKLTDLGREHVGSVEVTGGKVTLTAQPGIGYALYKTTAAEEPEMVWGEGSSVKDPGFDSQTFGNWKKSSTAASDDHIKFVKNSNADDQLQVKGPGDAVIQQEMTGLTPGKTYSASVWVKVDGKRTVEIAVKQGADKVVNTLDNTEHGFLAQQHKYVSTNFQRIKVTFDAVSETANLYLNVEDGSSTVTFDDVRVWENPTKTDAGNSVLFEDFENVDEGWGPFVYSKIGPVRTHLVEKGDNQIMTYVLDGNWSLKTNEDATGEWLRTLPHTLRMKEDNRYHLTMDYNSDETDMYTVAVRVKENGVVRDLVSENLKEGRDTLDLSFTTEGVKDAYLAIIKNKLNSQKELTGTLVVDNIRVDDEGAIVPEEGVLVSTITLTPNKMDLNKGESSSVSALVKPANAHDRTLLWTSDHPEIVSVDQAGKVTALQAGTAVITATAKDGSKKSATSTINVYMPNTQIPQSQMTATASSFQPGGEASLALDGDMSTIWHTKWTPAHLPESITLDLGGKYNINQFNYSPRVSGTNGTITSYNLYTSVDGTNFTKMAEGSWSLDQTTKMVRFTAVEATHLRLEAIEGVGTFASAAELSVFKTEDEAEAVKVTGVVMDKERLEIKVGSTGELNAAIKPLNASNKKVLWSSSDEAVATVEQQDDHALVRGLKAGEAVITATTMDGGFAATSRVIVSETDGELKSSSTLTAPSQVQPGEVFKVQYGLRNLSDKIFAQDIALEYAADVMDFVEARSLISGVSVIDSINSTPGKLRFIVASEGATHGVSNSADVLELIFKAKEVSQTVNGAIAVKSAIISDDQGKEISAANSSVNIEIGKKGTQGDINGDGKITIGDLAMVAAQYGKTTASPDWEKAKKADMDGDGKIGLEDLVIVARKIVE
ncbi:endo-alpha-N-acetylgalactosaminidase family protein [Paenibacillus nitricinens]|uniref:endo-alpha-N-acetylgalactosaminidase family protein n=1 Tax=Paenibacillus nitricinens TaxID=3367691 RepID=UPI003F86F6C0